MNELEELTEEIRLTFHCLVQAAESLHDEESISVPMRAVLEFLTKQSAATVPEIAKSRGVTRQHIQVQVNELINHGLVELRDNPNHVKSKLVAPTTDGEELFAEMQKRERVLMRKVGKALSTSGVSRAARTLRKLRECLNQHSGITEE